ncbi:uncharacterized protein EV420DRAFT_1037968 [Desarmillaria tabescens]|uniref:Uncharacterized protein n=1 Tax=Armillaria tabescens TaxID=1929756 RepID=A0AA39U086_ARMTA|nr:uncharacterized protein EV420DRAFT_1037968 [Desarmillaria tabescens]KAK0464355.1 hypothetical protein EV420DRAFT_1037968 [Desarmillaria tabescens]
MDDLDTALVTVRSHLVQVLEPSDSPRTRKNKKEIVTAAKKTLYGLIKMLEDDDDDDDEPEAQEYIERYNALIDAFDTSETRTRFLSARVFQLYMSRPIQTGIDAEQKGLLRLLHGYAGRPEQWAEVLNTPLESLQDWDSWCQQSQDNDDTEDFDDQLVFFPKMVQAFSNESDAHSYVQYVIRMIETLKFIERWNKQERRDGQSARAWKIKYIENAFKYSSSTNNDLWNRLHHLPKKIAAREPLNKALKKHSSEHARMITSRNTFYDLYKLFGPGVFLDKLWDPLNHRSKSFRPLLEHFTNNMPFVVKNGTSIPINVTRFTWGADSLYNILSVLASEAVAKHAQKFMQEHEPDGQAGTRLWGRQLLPAQT